MNRPDQPGLALVRLLQLASPALPVGAYTYSQGLEWAVESAAVIAVLPAFGLPATLWLGLVGLPLGLRAASRFRATANHTDPKAMQDIIPAQAWTLIAFLLMAVGLSLGALIG